MPKDIPAYILSIIIFTASILLGLLVDRFLIVKWMQRARHKKRPIMRIISESLSGILTIVFGLGGLYIALDYLPIRHALLDKLDKALIILIILSFTIIVARAVVGSIEIHGRRKKMPALTLFTNLTRIVVYIIGFLIILQSLGVSITPLLMALGVGGLAVALALQDTLSNLFSGIFIIGTRLIEPDDYIRLSTGVEGFVKDINWRNTIIRTMANNENIIPNSELAKSILTNYSRPVKEMSLIVPVSVSYDSDLSKVEKVVLEVAGEVRTELDGVVKEFEPIMRYASFGDSGININVILRIREFQLQYPIQHELIKRIHRRFKEEKIEIPFPMRTVIMRKQSENEKTDV